MRRVYRDRVAEPDILRSEEARRARIALAKFLSLTPAEQAQRRPPFDERLYLHSDVLSALRNLFHEKCAYCEIGLVPETESVDHYRPKSRAANLNGVDTRTAYVWLAYDWHNLLLACRTCQVAKRNYFPVVSRRAHLRATDAEIMLQESPELLDPTRDDPASALTFNSNGCVFPNNRVGEVTIAVVQLNRIDLVNARRRDLQALRASLPKLFARAREEELQLAFSPARQFAGARLDILSRSLKRRPAINPPPPTKRAEWPSWFAQWLPTCDEAERNALLESALGIFREDDDCQIIAQVAPEDLFREVIVRPSAVGTPGATLPARTIKTIRITNFKGIDEIVVQLQPGARTSGQVPAMILLGENAAGKSSVLEAVALALLGTEEVRKLSKPLSEWLRRDDPVGFHVLDPKPARIVVEFHDGGPSAELSISADGRHVQGTSGVSTLLLAYGSRRMFEAEIEPSCEPYDLVSNLLGGPSSMASPGPWLQGIRDSDRFAPVARALREILAVRDDDDVLIDDANRICVTIVGRPIPVERLSEGYRALFSLAVDIMRNLLIHWKDLESASAIVLIDEIEMHLHPRWKMRIMYSLRRAFPGVQFIVTTHDPLCIRGMEDGEVEVLERNGAGGVHRLEGLPSIRGMRSEQLLTSEYFGLYSTADPALERSLHRAGERVERETDPDDEALINEIVIGNTRAQQLIHEALDRYFDRRERRESPIEARSEAIEAILRVLEQDYDDETEYLEEDSVGSGAL